MNAKLINGQTKLSINILVKNEKDGRVSASKRSTFHRQFQFA